MAEASVKMNIDDSLFGPAYFNGTIVYNVTRDDPSTSVSIDSTLQLDLTYTTAPDETIMLDGVRSAGIFTSDPNKQAVLENTTIVPLGTYSDGAVISGTAEFNQSIDNIEVLDSGTIQVTSKASTLSTLSVSNQSEAGNYPVVYAPGGQTLTWSGEAQLDLGDKKATSPAFTGSYSIYRASRQSSIIVWPFPSMADVRYSRGNFSALKKIYSNLKEHGTDNIVSTITFVDEPGNTNITENWLPSGTPLYLEFNDLAFNTIYDVDLIIENTNNLSSSIHYTICTIPNKPIVYDLDASTLSFKVGPGVQGNDRECTYRVRAYKGDSANGAYQFYTKDGVAAGETVTLPGLVPGETCTIAVNAVSTPNPVEDDQKDASSVTYILSNVFSAGTYIPAITSLDYAWSGGSSGSVTATAEVTISGDTSVSEDNPVDIYMRFTDSTTGETVTQAVTGVTTQNCSVDITGLHNLAQITGKMYVGEAGSSFENVSDSYPYAELNFTTPDFYPGMPTVDFEWDDLRRTVTVTVTASPNNGYKGTRASLGYSSLIIRPAQSVQADEGPEMLSDIMVKKFSYLAPGKILCIFAKQTNNYGLKTGMSLDNNLATTPIPYPIWGIKINPDGTKENIIDIRTKDQNGGLSERFWSNGSNRIVKKSE